MPYPQTIRQGSSGEPVRQCQLELTSRGFHLSIDGVFGAKTDSAVRQFQASENLRVDGVVGPSTWARLLSDPAVGKPVGDALEAKREQLRALIPGDAPEVVRKALALACTDYGLREQPDGSNGGPQIQHLVGDYNAFWWVLREGVDRKAVEERGHPLPEELAPPMAWCGMAVTNWIRAALGLPWWDTTGWRKALEGHPWRYYYGGPGPIEQWAQERGSWVCPVLRDTVVPAGSVWTINRSWSNSDPAADPRAGHVGMTVRDNGNGTITTIEGNVSNGVGSYTRKKLDLRGFTLWW